MQIIIIQIFIFLLLASTVLAQPVKLVKEYTCQASELERDQIISYRAELVSA